MSYVKKEGERRQDDPDAWSVSPEAQQLFGMFGIATINAKYDDMLAHANEKTKEFMVANKATILRTLAAPVEAAIYGVSSIELLDVKDNKGYHGLLNAEPVPTYGELKARLVHMSEDHADLIADLKKCTADDKNTLLQHYYEIAGKMQDRVVELQHELMEDREQGFQR